MPITPHRSGAIRTGFRTAAAVALSVSLIALLAAIPTASANASNTVTPSIEIPNSNLGSLLETLPISDLGLTNLELENVLSRVGGLQGLGSGQLGTILSNLLNGNPQATLGELINGLLGNNQIKGLLKSLGLGLDSSQILEALNPEELSKLLGNINGEDISKLLSGLAGGLNPEQLGSLQSIIEAVTGTLTGSQLSKLQGDLKTALSELSKGEIEAVLTTLEDLLSGSSLTQLQGLLGNLGSLSPTELQTQLQTLLGSLNAKELSELLSTLVGGLSSSQLQTLLGDLLDGLPFSLTNVESLARETGMSVSTLGEGLGTSLESGAPAISSLLGSEGPVLSLIDGLSGLKLNLLGGGSENGSGGKGGNGGSGGNGSGTETSNTSQGGANGGNGGTGYPGAGSGQGETINVVLPASQIPAKTATKAVAKIKIVGHKVKGKVVTIVVQVASAGKITLSGAHVTKATRQAGKAGRFTLTAKLTKAGASSLRRHKNLLRVALKAAFKPSSGPSSSATTSVRFV